MVPKLPPPVRVKLAEERTNKPELLIPAEETRALRRLLEGQVGPLRAEGTHLWGGIPLNAVNIYAALPGSETFFDAFNVTRAGGNAPLFDQMLRGITTWRWAVPNRCV
jgi:hypothetical protein